MKLLAIETSCDETAVAVLDGRAIRADLIASQDDLHRRFGGIVPELAARRHIEVLPVMAQRALETANLRWADLEAVAVTRAPGLIGALLVGVAFAKAVAHAWRLPLVGVNHLEGHLLVAQLTRPDLVFPFVGLVVSGGHTSLYLAGEPGRYTVLGATRDDAAGEAFDKAATLLGLPFPGGPQIDRLAATGDPRAVRFPRARVKTKGSAFEIGALDFSFSGIKTALARHRAQHPDVPPADVAAGFQATVIAELLARLRAAVQSTGCRRVVVSGGVAANRGLRAALDAWAAQDGIDCFIPPLRHCTDNAVMIGWAGAQRLARGVRHDLSLNAAAVEELDAVHDG